MWQRQIQWSPASRACSIIPAGCGSWTMTKSNESSSAVRVLAVEDAECLLLLAGEPRGVALERVVNRLGDVEELVAPVDDAPFGLEPGAAHERHERVEDLGDPAPEGGRRQVQHALPGERLGQRADLVHEPPARDRRVVREQLGADVDLLEPHGGRRYRGSRSLVQILEEPQTRTAGALPGADVELVGDAHG